MSEKKPSRQTLWQRKKRAEGLCPWCGGVRDLKDRAKCGKCRGRDAEYYKRRAHGDTEAGCK